MIGAAGAGDEVPAEMESASLAAARLRSPWVIGTLRSWGAIALLGLIPGVLVLILVVLAAVGYHHGGDFATFWESGRLVLRGASPYPTLHSLPALAERRTFSPFVYPPVAAVVMVPLSLVPFPAASVLFLLIGLACVALSLRLLGVRDWRCYGAAFLAEPVFAAAGIGTVSLPLLLGAAAVWRYRERTVMLSALVALLVVFKLFLWPLWLWLLCTRRFGAAVLSVAIAGVVTFGCWGLIGLAGIHEYPQLLSRLSHLVGPKSFSVYALARAFGASSARSQGELVAVAALLAGIAGHVSRGPDRDRRLFVIAIGASLLLTPILWPHYLVLLFVPIALARPTLSPLWLLPAAFWFHATTWSYGRADRIVPVLVLTALGIALSLRSVRPYGFGPPALPERLSKGVAR